MQRWRPRLSPAFEFKKRFRGFNVGEMPHLDPEARVLFPHLLANSTNYLEFGAGGSTVLAARTNKVGLCIEGDRFFLRDVMRKIGDHPHRMTLLHADIGETSKWGYPWYRNPTPSRTARWRKYVETPFIGLEGDFYDFILVDGRFRVACVLKSLREGALRHASFKLLIDDYRGREYYRVIEDFVEIREMGRGALIEVSGGHMKQIPDDKIVETFIGDCR